MPPGFVIITVEILQSLTILIETVISSSELFFLSKIQTTYNKIILLSLPQYVKEEVHRKAWSDCMT